MQSHGQLYKQIEKRMKKAMSKINSWSDNQQSPTKMSSSYEFGKSVGQYSSHQAFYMDSNGPPLKLSFYHKDYLLPFKLSVPQRAVVSEVINYKELQVNFSKMVEQQLVFSTPEEMSLLDRIDIKYLQSFLSGVEHEKKHRIKNDFMGIGFETHLASLAGHFQGLSYQQDQNTAQKTSFLSLSEMLDQQKIDIKKLSQQAMLFIFPNEKTPIPNSQFNLKQTLVVIKYIQLRYLSATKFSSKNFNTSAEPQQLKHYILLFIVLLQMSYRLLTLMHQLMNDIHTFFLSSFLLIEAVLQTMSKISLLISNKPKFIAMIQLVFDISHAWIKDNIFFWTSIQKIPFRHQNKKLQSFHDGQNSFPIYKASVLIKVIQLIHSSMAIKNLVNAIGLELEQQDALKGQDNMLLSDRKKSAISWLLEEQNPKRQPNVFESMRHLSYLKNDLIFYQQLPKLYGKFCQLSILEHLINEISAQKKKNIDRQMAKKKNNHKNAYFFSNHSIQTNSNYIFSLMMLNKGILESYAQSTHHSQNSSKNGHLKNHCTNQLLLYVTQTLRYEFPEHIRKVEENIKERRYKLGESIVVKEVINKFKGTISTYINETLINQMINSSSHILSQNNEFKSSQIPYFKVKELLNFVKPTENDFLTLCKSLLKDLKLLSKEYHNFRSGKIIVERKSIQTNGQNDEIRKQNFIQKRKLKKESEDGQNFYQVYYFNYEGKSEKTLKITSDVGNNVNLIDLSSQSKGKIVDQHQKTTKMSKKKPSYQIEVIDQVQNRPHGQNPNENQLNHYGQQIIQTPKSMALSLPEQRSRIRKLSHSIEQSHNFLNHNNEILKMKDQRIVTLFKQNQELIKVNTWYQQQLRMREDKEEKLQAVIAQLMSFNKLKQDKLEKRRRQLRLCSSVLKDKIVQGKGVKFSVPHLEESGFRNSSNRMSKDSANRSREKSIVQQRLIQDLNRLSSGAESISVSPFILPQLPPPPNINQTTLPPVPQLLSPPSLATIGLKPPSLLPPPPLLMPPPFLGNPPTLPPIAKEEEKQPRKEMKQFGWTMVDVRMVPSSFWENLEVIELDEEDLIANFSKTPQTVVPQLVTTKQKQMQKKSLLKPDRVKNIEIGLRKARLRIENMHNLEQILYKYDENFFDEEIIDCLLSMSPTQKEKDEFSSITIPEGEIHQWAPADYFIYCLIRIESYEERLKAIHFKGEFQGIHSELLKKINVFIEFFEEFRNDEFMHSFLSHLLGVGNFLNARSHKANAYGFRLQSIPKTYTLIGQDHETSLFDYVLKMMLAKNQDLFVRYASFRYFEPHATKMLTALNVVEDDFSMLSKEIQNVQEIIIYSKQSDDNSSKYLLVFYIKAQEDINQLKKIISEAKHVFEEVVEFYCEKMNSQELIGFIVEFRKRVKEFMRVSSKKKVSQQQQSRLSWTGNQRHSMYQ